MLYPNMGYDGMCFKGTAVYLCKQIIYIFIFSKFPNTTTLVRRQSERLILSTNVDQKALETEFLIAICRSTGDKWRSKTLFLVIFDPRSSIV